MKNATNEKIGLNAVEIILENFSKSGLGFFMLGIVISKIRYFYKSNF